MKKIICSLTLLLTLTGYFSYAGEGFEGKIVAQDVEEPPQMVIKLTPPRSKDTPQQITISDEQGKFQFNDLEQGKYLLEMYHNNELIRREVIDTEKTPAKEIRLVPAR